jgi:hypothetical protein
MIATGGTAVSPEPKIRYETLLFAQGTPTMVNICNTRVSPSVEASTITATTSLILAMHTA